MFLNTLTKPFSYIYYFLTKRLEKKLGYKLVLPKDKNWIDGTMIYDMTPVWKKHGINAGGINYFTIGVIKDNISTRYNYLSPYYQAWLGGYLVRFSEDREWNADDHFNLGSADQKNWLEMYGDHNPYVKLGKTKFIKNIQLGKYKGKLYEGSGLSDTDVGGEKKSLILPILLSGFANILTISNPKLQLNYKNFIPNIKNNQLEHFQKISLKGYVLIVELKNRIKAVFYVNGSIFRDNFGKKYDYFENLKEKLLHLITQINILEVK